MMEMLLEREERHRRLLLERDEKLRQEAKEDLHEQKVEMQAQIEQLQAKLEPPSSPCVSDQQIAALQARLEKLHAAELLTEDELDALEDTVMSYVELRALAKTDGDHAMHAAAGKLSQLVAVSEVVLTDGVFARQARRRMI
jgi:hypothetical protein